MILQYDELTHTYTGDGIVYPSVTGILSSLFPSDNELWFTEYSRDKGTAIHRTIEYFNKNILDNNSIHEEVAPFFSAYKNFISDTGFIVKGSELRLLHETLGYAGTLDIVGIINDKTFLIDIKTGNVPKTVELQLNAYRLAFEAKTDFKIDFIRTLQLKSNGKYKLIQHEINDDFITVINFYNLKRRME